jgi:hypothetical protein
MVMVAMLVRDKQNTKPRKGILSSRKTPRVGEYLYPIYIQH